MFDEKAEVVEMICNLERTFADKGKGDLIPWGPIENVLGMSRFDNRARYVARRFRRRLFKKRGIVCLVKMNVGIELLTDSRTVNEIPALRQRKAYRQVNRALKETEKVSRENLTDGEIFMLAAQRENMRRQRLQIGRSRRDLKKMYAATEVNPQMGAMQSDLRASEFLVGVE